jgi:hypothetical protein
VNFDRLNLKRLDHHERIPCYTTAYSETQGGQNRIIQMLGEKRLGLVGPLGEKRNRNRMGASDQGIRDFLKEIWPDLMVRLAD